MNRKETLRLMSTEQVVAVARVMSALFGITNQAAANQIVEELILRVEEAPKRCQEHYQAGFSDGYKKGYGTCVADWGIQAGM